MSHHRGFGIVKCLDLEQGGRAPDLVERTRLAKHQPLAAQCFDTSKLCLQIVDPFPTTMRMKLRIRLFGLLQQFLQLRLTFLAAAPRRGSIEDEIPDLSPMVALV